MTDESMMTCRACGIIAAYHSWGYCPTCLERFYGPGLILTNQALAEIHKTAGPSITDDRPLLVRRHEDVEEQEWG